jgi:hypothetical protein
VNPVPTLVDHWQLLRIVIASVLLGGTAGATTDDDELPDVEFLEYLGSWEESDEDWVLVSDVDKARNKMDEIDRSDPAPQGEESMETENEG